MSKNEETTVASDGGPELTSEGVPWREVPEFARWLPVNVELPAALQVAAQNDIQ